MRPESILLLCVWLEFDHLLDTFVHWKGVFSVCFVSSAPGKCTQAAHVLFHRFCARLTQHLTVDPAGKVLFVDPPGTGARVMVVFFILKP